ncbi:MAG: hypothetical protein EA367_17675 [Leptolyngbya sp. DLM2.Bin15]|nr:MAG: hypothetical protein EA367_17675 [Leptolyngbya sp. DLM2.Bin15]
MWADDGLVPHDCLPKSCLPEDDPEERQQVAFGNLIFAGEHLSDAYYGYMNGAVETGRLAAGVAQRLLTMG